MLNQNLLKGVRIYLAGQIENINKTKPGYLNWRDRFEKLIKPLGMVCLSPLKKTFKNFPEESPKDNAILKERLAAGEYDEVSRAMKIVRKKDLRLVDIGDVILTYLDLNTNTWGTLNEIYLAETLRRPSYLILDGGFRVCPLWLTAVYAKEDIFDSLESFVEKLIKLDQGFENMDSKFWRVLSDEYLR